MALNRRFELVALRQRNARLFTLSCLLAAASGASCAEGGGRVEEPAERAFVAQLTRAATCDDVLAALRADAEAKILDQAWQVMAAYDYQITNPGYYYGGGGGLGGIAPEPPLAGGVPESDGAAGGGPSHFTDTNVQVEGVDEPDFVKTDGERIFVLHGDALVVFRSWPAAETAEVGRLEVEGSPTSMFLAGDKAVVFSNVSFASPAPGGGTGGGIAIGSPAPAGIAPADVAWGGGYPYGYRSFTKVTVLDVANDAPAVLSERYVEGNLRDARRHDAVVRAILDAPTWQPQWGGALPNTWNELGELRPREELEEAVIAWRDERLAAIAAQDLDGFLPAELVKQDDELVAVPPRCDGYYAPPAGQAGYGMAEVLTFSLDDLDTAGSVYVLGSPSVIYANHDALLITQDDWRWDGGLLWASAFGRFERRTILHELALGGGSTTYVGSGALPGYVNDQFSLDESDGVIRIALTEEGYPETVGGAWVAPTRTNRVVTLAAKEGELVALGSTPPLAENESIFAVRYIGDRAYVVTFRQVDPLFVIDLADPAHPTVLGEVKIPGFSTYMHPLGDDHLLTIGRYVDPVSGVDEGLALQIFDVSDPAAPMQVQSHVIGGYSSAEWDHKAFVFDAVSNLLAVPVDRYDATFESSLRLFHVSVADGFAEAGTIDHTALFDACVTQEGDAFYYGCPYSASMRRGLFIDDYVYALSFGGLTVHALAEVNTPVASVALPQPEFYSYYYPGTGAVAF